MLRPDKKYSVYGLRKLKGKPCLTHVDVPRHATWTNFRAIGKTATEARQLYEQM